MKRYIGNARRVYFSFRTEQGAKKTVPVRGVYVSRKVDENGHVILQNVVQNEPEEPDNNN
jgi:hypothetical protein